MTSRTASWLVWSLCGLYLALMVATIGLIASGRGTADEAFVVLSCGFAIVGALVARREPKNAVGWLLLTIAVAFAEQGFLDAYVRDPRLPGIVVMAWFAGWSWYVWLYLSALALPLIFPNGRLLSRRWRPVLWVAGAALALSVLSEGLGEGRLDVDSPEPIHNPLGVGGPIGDVIDAAGALGNVLAATGFVLGAVSLALRLRRSRGRERLQVKLFAYVGVLALASLVLAMVDVIAGPSAPTWVHVLGAVGWTSALGLIVIGVPAAVGVAILRHRLYGIDVVINRTLVYAALTATLVATYLGSVLVFRLLLSPLTGDSDLAVAGSTLAVAAAFRPARSRIQRLVDQRFYRSRYDASRTLETFATHLRDELDLEALGTDLRRVVRDTMQPAHVSLWLRGSP